MPENKDDLPLGRWGATGISIVVQDNSVSIELPCANLNIPSRPKLNGKGEFEAAATYNPEGPGAARVDPDGSVQPRASKKATVRGTVSGKRIELSITLEGSEEKLGTYSAELGKSGRMLKCM